MPFGLPRLIKILVSFVVQLSKDRVQLSRRPNLAALVATRKSLETFELAQFYFFLLMAPSQKMTGLRAFLQQPKKTALNVLRMAAAFLRRLSSLSPPQSLLTLASC